MHGFLLLLTCFSGMLLNAQDGLFVKHLLVPERTDVISTQSQARVFCYSATPASRQPIFVVDGVIKTKDDLARVNPDEIETIDVIKNATEIIPGCHSLEAVIIVTLKRLKDTRLKIVDEADSIGISHASIQLTLNGKTSMLFANEKGFVTIPNMIKKHAFTIAANSAGFASITKQVSFDSSGQTQTLFLKRDISPLEIQIHSTSLSGQLRCLVAGVKAREDLAVADKRNQANEISASVFPNPVKANSSLTVLLTQKMSGRYQVVSMAGRIVCAGTLNHTPLQPIIISTSGFSNGIYFVQLQDTNFNMTRTEKFIVQ